MVIKDIKIKKDDLIIIRKKTLFLIASLIILGIITGFILSNVFLIEANQKIDHWNNKFDNWGSNWNSNNTGNGNHSNFQWGYKLNNLSASDTILPSLGVISICISMFLLLGLIIIYLKVFIQYRSPYVSGLLFVLLPLFIISLFFLNVLRSLYFASAFHYDYIGQTLGFGIGGLGGIIGILSLFEIIGLTILLYLSME